MAGLASPDGNGSGQSVATGYQSFRRKRALKKIGEINVTPLVDVVLVLLLVFMVTAPMMSQGIDINLPTANQVENQPEDRLTVSLNAEGRAFLGAQPLALPLLEDRIRAYMAGRPTQVVYLRADEAVRYGKVIEVVDLLKRCGVERIGFAYEIPRETP
jgi:biopolymer transport protein TolR